MRRRSIGAALAVALTAGLAAAGAPAAGGAGLLGAARLQGQFAMTGHVTDALNAGGEVVGETVERAWTFSSTCPADACPTVALKRARTRTGPPAFDQLTLRRQSPGYYTGASTFLAPERCAGVRYAKGEAVPFTITVRVTAAQTIGGQVLATGVRAFYRNPRRIGLTRCVTLPAHDAARYTGKLVISPGPAIRTERRTAPSVAS
jgi:hypothetical protein